MVKRLLSCSTSDIEKMSGSELKQSILASEGRIICTETVVMAAPVANDITNAEVARAYGADLILLNGFDCLNPVVMGLPGMTTFEDIIKVMESGAAGNPIAELKRLVGKPIGANLEPVDLEADMAEDLLVIPEGRMCSEKTLKAAEKLGLDFICLTGNPGTGVTNKEIGKAIVLAKKHFSGLIIAGKMHGAGVAEPVASLEAVKAFVAAGADVILFPAVGTVPGFTDSELIEAVKLAKSQGSLTMSAIGTSQESADQETVKQIALRNKICGVDIQHIGDAGYGGMAPAENIYTMSLAIRGMRHTLNRVSRSINR